MSSYDDLTISKYVVAAICGNWWRESGVNPQVWESLIPCAWDFQYDYTNKGGYGLGQWTNVGTPHGRLWHLHEWVNENGYEDGDGYGQLEYLLVENVWSNSSQSRLDYSSLAEFLESDSTDLDDLVWDFLANWEGVPGDHYEERCEYAQTVLDYLNEHEHDTEQFEWIASNTYLPTSDRLNNAMVIFQYMSGKGFPWWLVIAMKKNNERRLKPYVRN